MPVLYIKSTSLIMIKGGQIKLLSQKSVIIKMPIFVT